jgi:F0F1-type ATP synthase assembly protein I
MPDDQPPDARELGYYFTLAQVGLEMVAPLVVGLVIDYWAGWGPWATLAGIVLGFVGGMVHLVMLANKQDGELRERKPPGNKPL